MVVFEEKNNAAKDELIFGGVSSHGIRMLGSWMNPKVDVQNRIKRVGFLWSKVRPRLFKIRLFHRQKAILVQSCVEIGLLFDAAFRPWQKQETKKMQQLIDKRYTYVLSQHKEPPLKTMQKSGRNMQEIWNTLGIVSIQLKIKNRSMQRIGHVFRLDNERPVKRAMLGWLLAREQTCRNRKKTGSTPQYWRRLIREAGIDPNNRDRLTAERKEWPRLVSKRDNHLVQWEKSRGNQACILSPVNTEAPDMPILPQRFPKRCRPCDPCKTNA